MKNHCLLLRLHNALVVAVAALAMVAVGILLFSPKYQRHTEPEVEIEIIGVTGEQGDKGDKGAKGDTGPKGATGDKGATGPGFWGPKK